MIGFTVGCFKSNFCHALTNLSDGKVDCQEIFIYRLASTQIKENDNDYKAYIYTGRLKKHYFLFLQNKY